MRHYSHAFYEANSKAFEDLADFLNEDTLVRFIKTASAVAGLDITDKVNKIKCPVLVIGSKGDKVLSGDASVEIAALTGEELYMYGEETSHAIYDEIPEIKGKALTFLRK